MRIKINIAMLPLVAAACAGVQGAPDAGSPMVAVHYPQLPNGGGPILTSATLIPVTFGTDSRAQEFSDYVSWLAGSGWLTEAGQEYGVQHVQGGTPIALAADAGSALSADDLKALIEGSVMSGVLPNAASSLYVVFLPDGVSLLGAQGNQCRITNPGRGLHDAVGTQSAPLPYVAVPTCPARFSSIFSDAQSMEFDAARLVLDTLTDPQPRDAPALVLGDTSSPWAALGPEVDDFCWGRFFTRDGHTLQRAWSNAAAAAGHDACVPAATATAFGLEVAPTTLQTLTVGQPVELTMTGWANGTVDDWTIRALPWVGDFTITAQLDKQTLNAGQQAKLTLTVPFDVPHGTYGAVVIHSTGKEDAPQWPVSFVVQ